MVIGYLKRGLLSYVRSERLRKITEVGQISKNSRLPGQNSNPMLSEHKSNTLPAFREISLQCSIHSTNNREMSPPHQPHLYESLYKYFHNSDTGASCYIRQIELLL